MKKKKCKNPYVTIMLFTMAAVGVVSIADKIKAVCNEKMENIKEKMPTLLKPKAQ